MGLGGVGLLLVARRAAVCADQDEVAEIRVRWRVGKPLASWPQGETICWRPPPPFDLPWPPPFGWSTGFIATPRTRGRLPSQRLRPALPSESLLWSPLPTTPIVARHLAFTMRISPEGILSCAKPFSTPTSSMLAPAERPIWAPLPGTISTQWTRVDGGMMASGKLLPTVKSFVVAVFEATILSPGLRPSGAGM